MYGILGCNTHRRKVVPDHAQQSEHVDPRHLQSKQNITEKITIIAIKHHFQITTASKYEFIAMLL